jgi:hypothetical protein
MRPEDLRDVLRRQPFVPFRIHMTDGRAFDVSHPEFVLVYRTYFDVAIPSRKDGIMERSERAALIHIVSVEDMPRESTQPSN